MRRLSNPWAMLRVALIAWLASAGCQHHKVAEKSSVNFYLASRQDLMALNRVVFVEVGQDNGYPQVASAATEALFQAVQSRQLFHMDVVARNDRTCRDLPMGLSETYTMQQLVAIREALKCDAVLFGAINHFQPHPRMQMGLYLRLLDLRKGKLLWAVDHVWDSTDKATQARIEDFFAHKMGSGYDPVDWRLALVSPAMFERFVAYEVAWTLPARGEPDSPTGAPPTDPVRSARRQLGEVGQGMQKFQSIPQEVADSFDN